LSHARGIVWGGWGLLKGERMKSQVKECFMGKKGTDTGVERSGRGDFWEVVMSGLKSATFG